MTRTFPILLCTILLSILLAIPLPNLRFDNTPESWLPANSPGLKSLTAFRETFGDGSFLLAYVEGNNLPSQILAFQELKRKLSSLPGIAMVIPPPFVEEESDGPKPPIMAYLASPDQKHAAFLLLPKENLPASERGLLVKRLEHLLSAAPPALQPVHLAGTLVVTADLDSGSRESMSTLGPLVALALALVLFVTTREWRAVAAALLVMLFSSLWVLGLVAYFGRPMNLVLATMPAILAVATITQAMHILSFYHCLPEEKNRMYAWREAIAATFRPNLLCAVTTAAGFASLATSSIPPVRDLGIFTSIGVMAAFLLCFTLFPALLSLSSKVLPRGVAAQEAWSPKRADRFTRWLSFRRLPVLWITAAFFLVALVGIYRIRVESDILEFFPASHRVPINYHSIERHLMGLTPIDIVLSGPRDVLLQDRALNAYRTFFAETLRDEPLARQVVSILLEPSRDGKMEFVLSPAELREAIAEEELPASLRPFVKIENQQITLRTTILATTSSTNAVYAMIERLRARLALNSMGTSVHGEIAGPTPLLIEGQMLLLQTQIQSFGSALAVISLVILVAFRSLRAALLGLVPNLVPIALTLGFMGWAQIPLNTATVTVAGIALGLIVDDTIHFLHYYLKGRREATAAEAVRSTLLHMAKPAAITSLAVTSGFALFALSPFRPTAYFGLLIAITAATALVCDLVFLPALLLRTQQQVEREEVLHQ